MEINPNSSASARADFKLVQDAKRGDQKAYTKLMDRYKDSVYFLTLKIVKNRDDAMDLTADTFGKAFIKLDKYKPDFAFSTWLFRVATNNSIDFLRRKKMAMVSLDEEGLELKEDSLNPEEKSIKRQEYEYLRGIVDHLPSDYRKIVALRYYDDLTYDEIAQLLNMPVGTIKARLFRAREMILHILNQQKIYSEF